MKALILASLLGVATIGQAQDYAYCFTRAELEAAADSALKGQAAVRSLTLAFVLASTHKHEAAALRAANADLTRAIDAAVKEAGTSADRARHIEGLYLTADRKKRRRGTINLVLGAALVTAILIAQ